MTGRPDRRDGRRVSHAALPGGLTARIRPGNVVRIVDVGKRGALVETRCRLRPGSIVAVHIETSAAAADLRAVVGRTYVSCLRGDYILFRAALSFDRDIWWICESRHHVEAE